MSEVPETNIPIVGKRIDFRLRGVGGFSQIILKLLSTFDVEFIKCHRADKYLIITSRAHFQNPLLFHAQVYNLHKKME